MLYCKKCHDVVKLIYKKRFCQCKESSGFIKDDLENGCGIAYIKGDCIPFAIDNNYLMWAQNCFENDRRTSFIQAWTIDPTQEKNGVVFEN